MIFLGRKHSIFSSFIDSKNISHFEEVDTLKNLPKYKGMYFTDSYFNKSNKSSYFLHSEAPIISPTQDIEYIFNIEDQMTLYRFSSNGKTKNITFADHPENDMIRYILEDDRCKKIICHIEQMAEALPNLLKSKIIKDKTEFQKIGIPFKKNKQIEKENFTILFTNSFHNSKDNFYFRGGHFLLAVFLKLIKKHPNINLILRSNIPEEIYIPDLPNIKVIKEFISDEELEKLYLISDICVLPSCRVHSHSICQAFSYGLPVIGSNGWGVEEFIEHEYNGLIINNFEKISWNDNKVGCIENYLYINDGVFKQYVMDQLYYYLEFLINNLDYLNILKQNCEKTCKQDYPLSNWDNWVI